MSGDMRIKGLVDGSVGTANRVGEIDAHSVSSGDFTQPRSVLGKQVFLTPDGAQLFDGLIGKGFRFEALADPTGFFDKLMGAKQACTGKVSP